MNTNMNTTAPTTEYRFKWHWSFYVALALVTIYIGLAAGFIAFIVLSVITGGPPKSERVYDENDFDEPANNVRPEVEVAWHEHPDRDIRHLSENLITPFTFAPEAYRKLWR